MPYIKKRIKRKNCAVFGASNNTPDACSNISAICSGAIEQILNAYTTHSGKKPAKPCNDLILPQSPVNTTLNRGFFGVSLVAQSTVSAQANRGFSAGTFAAIGGAV